MKVLMRLTNNTGDISYPSKLKGTTVDGAGNPAPRIVRIHRQADGYVIGAQCSWAEGDEYVFRFAGLPEQNGKELYAIALDPAGIQGADVASGLTLYSTEPVE